MLSYVESPVQGDLRPPAPLPRTRPLGPLALLKTLWRNPLEAWSKPYFERPVVTAKLPIGRITVVSEPQAVRRILLENAANYRKDGFQRRMMSATLSNGLLMAEDEQWRAQRRTIAPVFAHKTVVGFAPNMLEAAEALVARWRRNPQDT